MEMKRFIFFKLKKNVTPDATHSVNRGMTFTDKSTWFDTTGIS